MESKLSGRFTRVAKRFGKGLKTLFTGGGWVGAAIVLINKILNPLKEVQESIDRSLKRSDDLVTNASQFNTTAGKLARLQAFGQATGLEPDQLSTLISKFQTAMAEAAQDPTKDTSVRNFVGIEDTADAFFEFIQALQKMDKNQQILVQQEVFGEKQTLKMADFLQSDFKKLSKYFDGLPAEKITRAAEKTAGLSDLSDALKASRELEDVVNKSRLINADMITARDRQEREELKRENERIKTFESLQAISTASTQIMMFVEKGIAMLGDILVKVTSLTDVIKKVSSGSIFRGIFGGKDK